MQIKFILHRVHIPYAIIDGRPIGGIPHHPDYRVRPQHIIESQIKRIQRGILPPHVLQRQAPKPLVLTALKISRRFQVIGLRQSIIGHLMRNVPQIAASPCRRSIVFPRKTYIPHLQEHVQCRICQSFMHQSLPVIPADPDLLPGCSMLVQVIPGPIQIIYKRQWGMQGIGEHPPQQAITRHHTALQDLRIADTIQQGAARKSDLAASSAFLTKCPACRSYLVEHPITKHNSSMYKITFRIKSQQEDKPPGLTSL